VKSVNPLEVLQLPTPKDIYATVIHPLIEIKTSESRAILPSKVELENAIHQWANVGSFVHALHTNDYELLSRSLKDVVVEPYRSQLIPSFKEVKQAVLDNGALGCSISGAGPSIFTLNKGLENANRVKQVMHEIYEKTDIDFEIHVTKINEEGVKILN
jgi:homoserine kinase